jgi:PadR family transcriptional regulator, regulatory protein PadR
MHTVEYLLGTRRRACTSKAFAFDDAAYLCRLARMPRLTWQTQAILAALLRDASNPHYGLEMGRDAGLPSGTIYPILARLERAGWVQSELEQIDPKVAGRRARRYYTLTGDGEELARAEISTTLERLSPQSDRPVRAPRRLRPVPRGHGIAST